MLYLKGTDVKLQNSCVAFGHFDGVHLGHRAVIEALKAEAKKSGLNTVVVALEEPGMVLTTPREKQYIIEKLGVDALISVNEAEIECKHCFVKDFILGALDAKKIVCAEQVFGGKDELKKLAAEDGAEVVEIQDTTLDGEPVNKQAVIQAIEANDFPKVLKLLGGPYVLIGPVCHGKAEGRQHGMPTANLGFDPTKILPPLGVYGALSIIEGVRKQGMTNIGRRPSADNMDYISVETNILDFSGDVYDKEQILECHIFIRGVMKFNGLDEVRKQIDKDIEGIKDFLKTII